jgi:hypothetical protein
VKRLLRRPFHVITIQGIYAPESPLFPTIMFCLYLMCQCGLFVFAFSEPASDTRILFVRQERNDVKYNEKKNWCGAELSLEERKS